MSTAQHSTTTCQVFLHPSVIDPFRAFEVRRLARDGACEFKGASRMRTQRPKPQGPWNGGNAA